MEPLLEPSLPIEAELARRLQRIGASHARAALASSLGAEDMVLLDAIARSGQRAGVIDAVRETKVTNGITGSFSILPSGDPSIGPITISVAKNSFVPVREVDPGPGLVKAARHG